MMSSKFFVLALLAAMVCSASANRPNVIVIMTVEFKE